MKRETDPRHIKRIRAIQELFGLTFYKFKVKNPLAQEVAGSLEKIDKKIKKAAKTWPVEKINKIDLAILRLAVFELCFKKKEPPKVIIDEAVELAKKFGGETSAPFVNGVLGTIIKKVL